MTKLLGGGKLGHFWCTCKFFRKCRGSPYNRLLINPVLRGDYRVATTAQENDDETSTDGGEAESES